MSLFFVPVDMLVPAGILGRADPAVAQR